MGTIMDIQIRNYGRFNGFGTWVFYKREVQRFLVIPTQTILGPMVTSILFLSIFMVSFKDRSSYDGAVGLIDFLIPGFLMMQIIQNTVASSMTNLVSAKMNGAIVDYLMPPLNEWEIIIGTTGACITRGVIVGAASATAMYAFNPFSVAHPLYLCVIILLSTSALGIFGMIAGIWARKWDESSSIFTYFIVPMSFLSGTFYNIDRLPEFIQKIVLFNPFFYMINGTRYAIIGHNDISPMLNISVVLGCNAVLFTGAYYILKSGWRLKA